MTVSLYQNFTAGSIDQKIFEVPSSCQKNLKPVGILSLLFILLTTLEIWKIIDMLQIISFIINLSFEFFELLFCKKYRLTFLLTSENIINRDLMVNFFNDWQNIFKLIVRVRMLYISYINIHLEKNVDLKTGFLRMFFLDIYRSQTDCSGEYSTRDVLLVTSQD